MYREEPSGANFMLGILTGAFVGAAVALLYAPKSGTEMRARLGEQYRGLADRVGEQTGQLRETASQLSEQGRDRIKQASNKLSDRMSSTGERITATSETDRFPSSAPTV
jgi:gas vesicle protein